MTFDLLWNGCLDWLLPAHCCACGKSKVTPRHPICYQCLAELNETAYEKADHQKLEKMFWGRIRLQTTLSLYPLKKGSPLQKILHQTKYHHRPSIGIYLGKLAGKKLTHHPILQDIDALVPLPLHPSKQRKRGYNQAEKISQGISMTTGIPVWNNLVIRNQSTETQTRKDRGERWDNMSGKFSLRHHKAAHNKHLLLIDDVITTGATLEACGQTLLQIPNARLSFFTLAHTETH